jgi:tetraacyldisaccharide 4'-kinase
VVSIGNLSLGGTGKTPIVIEVCRQLLGSGKKVAILTRGYRSGLDAGQWVVLLNGAIVHSSRGVSKLQFHGDEPRLQSVKLGSVPIIAGAKRWEAAQRYLEIYGEQSVDVWVLDDGYQHLKLARQLDIVLGAHSGSWLSEQVLPSGYLREGLSSLKDADFVLLTRAPLTSPAPPKAVIDRLKKFGVSEESVGMSHLLLEAPRCPNGSKDTPTAGSSVILISAIAGHDQFQRGVEGLGYRVARHFKFADHSLLPSSLIGDVMGIGLPCFTTEKDFYRYPQFFVPLQQIIFVCPISMTLPQSLIAMLNSRILSRC